jgi:tRNA (mo5U34)-methyltransferase
MSMDVTDFSEFYEALLGTPVASWKQVMPEILEKVFAERQHGDWERWQSVFQQLPDLRASSIDLDKGRVTIGSPNDCDDKTLSHLEALLKQYHPWRKGPYELFGIHINTEWRSDWKWDRLAPHIASLQDRCVLDVGCGNGYHMWRMRAAGAKLVIGADPSLFFLMQFSTMKHYIGQEPVYLLPLKSEDLPVFPSQKKGFDTVFSMGVFYHRRSPMEHLLELKQCLRSGGELVLETLVVDGDENTMLIPEDRYAQMRNVWFLPSTAMLERMLRRAGFINVRTVDVCQTTVNEQRSTEWMEWDSLPDFLDPANPDLSIEGYQAPTRAIIVCNRS